jgi:hypothetical protein
LTRFGETSFVPRESVVTRNAWMARGTICSRRMSLATVLRQQATPSAESVVCRVQSTQIVELD